MEEAGIEEQHLPKKREVGRWEEAPKHPQKEEEERRPLEQTERAEEALQRWQQQKEAEEDT